MRELLKELKNQGKAILLASHNAKDIEELCDMVLTWRISGNEILQKYSWNNYGNG